MQENPDINPADIAYTLQIGRKAFPHRKMLVYSNLRQGAVALASPYSKDIRTARAKNEAGPVIFMFSGLGSQYVDMGLGLYETEEVFRREMDRCFTALAPLIEDDIKLILYPGKGGERACSSENINRIENAQLTVFIIEYALARLLEHWGIKPEAAIGYSFGEYTAACFAGVFSLEDAIKLIVARGNMLRSAPPGAMLSIPLPVDDVISTLSERLAVAIDNCESCIISGSPDDIQRLEEDLKKQKIIGVHINTNRALHTSALEPLSTEFKKCLESLTFQKPTIPYISNVTGTWIDAGEVVKPDYWLNHLTRTVKFSAGAKELVKKKDALFLEIGPGQDISTLMLRYLDKKSGQKVLNILRQPHRKVSDANFILNQVGRLWLWGLKIDWERFHNNKQRYRLPLPTYSFAASPFPVPLDAFRKGLQKLSGSSLPGNRPAVEDWFYLPTWERCALSNGRKNPDLSRWLVFTDECGVGSTLIDILKSQAQHVIIIRVGERFEKTGDSEYTLQPGEESDYIRLFNEPWTVEGLPDNILHLWGITGHGSGKTDEQLLDRALALGYDSLLHLAKCIGTQAGNHRARITVVTDHMQDVNGDDLLCPEKATILGPVKTIPYEYPNITCRCIDLVIPATGIELRNIAVRLITEAGAAIDGNIIAYRGKYRWIQRFVPRPFKERTNGTSRLK